VTRGSQVSAKTVATVCFTALGIAALVFVAMKCRTSISITVASILVGIALERPTRWLQRHKLGRGLAVAVTILGTLVLLAGGALLVVPPVVAQTRALVRNAPTIVETVRQTRVYRAVDARIDIDDKVAQLRRSSPGIAEHAVDPARRAARGVIQAVTAVVTVCFLSVFMLLFGGKRVRGILAQASPERRVLYERVCRSVYESVGGYLAGLFLICSVNAVCTTVFLAIIRVPFFLPLGLVAGVSSLIPVAGNLVAGVLLVIVALLAGGLWKAVAVTIYALAYQQVENHVLGPLVYRRTIDLNPLVVIVSLLFFLELGGIGGAIVALPAIACAKIVIGEVLALRRPRAPQPAVDDDHAPRPAPRRPPDPIAH
jgi:predicted PurR-regulated permease PerM